MKYLSAINYLKKRAPITSTLVSLMNSLLLMEHFLGVLRWQRAHAAVLNTKNKIEAYVLPSREPGRIEGLQEVTKDAFLADSLRLIRNNRPFVVRGFAEDWPCLRLWSPEFFRQRYGNEKIDLLDKPGTDHPPKTFKQILNPRSAENHYIRFSNLVDKYEDLKKALKLETLPVASPRFRTSQLFISKDRSQTHWHCAITCNFFIQIFGEKKWYIVHPKDTAFMKTEVEGRPFFMSRFGDKIPDILQVSKVRLRPGDLLFNPSFFWHYVFNPCASVGLGLRWIDLSSSLKSSKTLLLLTLLSTNPPLLKSLNKKESFTSTYLNK